MCPDLGKIFLRLSIRSLAPNHNSADTKYGQFVMFVIVRNNTLGPCTWLDMQANGVLGTVKFFVVVINKYQRSGSK